MSSRAKGVARRSGAPYALAALFLSAATLQATNTWCAIPFPPCDPSNPSSAAQCYIPQRPDKRCNCDQGGQTAADGEKCRKSPCYVGTGSYATSAVDLQIRTPGFPLQVSRAYDSTHLIDGAMGIGWSSTAGGRLTYAVYLLAAPTSTQKEADITLPNGSLLRFTQTGSGPFTPPPGSHDTLVQNGDGSFDLTFARSMSVYHFDPTGNLTTMKDDYGNTLALTYSGSRLQQISDQSGSGRYLTFTWGPDGRLSSAADSTGRSVQYAFNPDGTLHTFTDPASRVTTLAYVIGRFAPMLAQIADNWNRVVTEVTYDTNDRVSSYTENGETYTYTYNYNNSATTAAKTDSAGHRWVYPFNAGSGLVSDVTPPAGGTTHTDYYPDGSVQQVIDPVGVKTFYTYNADGSPASVTRDYQGPNAVRFDYTYDPALPGRVTSIVPKNPSTNAVDPNWQGWQYDYYHTGDPSPGALHHVYRVRSDDVTLDTLSTYAYGNHGRITRQTSAIGGVTDYAYDANGNLHTITGTANNDAGTRPTTTYGYDTLGRVLSVTDPLGNNSSYTYDALDRVSSTTLPVPYAQTPPLPPFTTSYAFDSYDAATGLVFTTVTDPNGRTSKQGYDQFGRLVRSVDALGNTTSYGYTRAQLTSVTDANGNATTYGYDSASRLTATTFPDSAAEQYTYTADNLLYQRTDRNAKTQTFTYDHFKRLSQKAYPGGTTITYTYIGQKLTQVVDTSVSPTETHTLAYDTSYRLQSETQASRGTVTHTYNADDTVQTAAIQSGPTTTFTYYPDGSLDTIAWSPVAGTFKYTYTLPGRYQSITFPNGQTRSLSYDNQGRLTQLANLASGGGNLATYAYGYDLNYTTGAYTMLGQRISLTATVPSQGLSAALSKYEYDSLYQLVKATYPASYGGDTVDSWTYDAIGNRTAANLNGSLISYTYQTIGSNPKDWQRLLFDGSFNYSYNANGDTIEEAGSSIDWLLGWSFDDRMISASKTGRCPNGTSSSYTATAGYDYQGRRVTVATNSTPCPAASTSLAMLYDGLNRVADSGTAGAVYYLFGPSVDEPLAMSAGGQVYYYNVDGLGSVTQVTNSGGSVQNNYIYDAWGSSRFASSTVANPLTYTAREGGLAGSLYYRARYYQPSIGRFLQEDLPNSRLLAGSLYAYVGSDPLNWIDHDGLTRASPRPTPPPTPRPRPTPPWLNPPNLPPVPLPNPLFNRCQPGETLLFWTYVYIDPNNTRAAEQFWAVFDQRCRAMNVPPFITYSTRPAASSLNVSNSATGSVLTSSCCGYCPRGGS